MSLFKTWLVACRIWTLPAALTPVTLGAVYAAYNGSINILLFILTAIAGCLLQVGSNLINCYGDFKSGVDTGASVVKESEILGGLITAKQVYNAGILTFILAFLIGIIFAFTSGWQILLFGFFGIASAYGYTAGAAYKYIGLGQISVFVSMGILMVLGSYFVQLSTLTFDVFLISLPLGFLVTAILAANEMRDFIADKEAGIKTFSIVLGRERGAMWYKAMLIIAFVLEVILVLTGYLPILALISFLSLPLALKNIKLVDKTKNDDIASGKKLVPSSSKLSLVFGMLMSLGIVIDILIF